MRDGKKIQFWLGMGFSLVCLAAIFLFVDVGQIIEGLRTANYGYISLSVLGILAFMVIRAIRWRFMLNNDIPFLPIFHIQNIGYMLTNLLPFRIGDVARAILIGNVPPITLARGLSTMVVERVLDMMFIVALLPFTLAEVETLPDWMQTGAQASGILALIAIVMLVVAANKRPLANRLATLILNRLTFLDTDTWLQRLDNILAGLVSLTRLRDGLILAALSILVWLPIIFAYYMGLLAVNLEPTVAMAGFVVCAAALSIALPSSPGQIGVFHAGVIAALAVLGQPEAPSASFAFIYHALNVLFMVLLGIIGIQRVGATFGNVVSTTQRFLQRDKTEIGD